MESSLNPPDFSAKASNKVEFYCAPIWKVALFNYLTFGFYWWFWQYYQWRAQKNAHSLKINPTFRVILGIFYIPSLSSHLKKAVILKGSRQVWLHRLWSFGLVTFSILCAFGSIAGANGINETANLYEKILFQCILDLMHIVFIATFQSAANRVSNYSDRKLNNKFNILQWIFVILGILVRIIFFYGLTLY